MPIFAGISYWWPWKNAFERDFLQLVQHIPHSWHQFVRQRPNGSIWRVQKSRSGFVHRLFNINVDKSLFQTLEKKGGFLEAIEEFRYIALNPGNMNWYLRQHIGGPINAVRSVLSLFANLYAYECFGKLGFFR